MTIRRNNPFARSARIDESARARPTVDLDVDDEFDGASRRSYNAQEVQNLRELQPLAASVETSDYIADFNYKLRTIQDYIQRAPINLVNQKKLNDELTQLFESASHDDSALEKIKAEAERLSTEGDLLIKSLAGVIDSVEGNTRIQTEEQARIVEGLRSIAIGYRDGNTTLETTIEGIKTLISDQIEQGTIDRSILTDLLDTNIETNRLTQSYNTDILGDIALTQDNALAQEVRDNLAAFTAILENNNLDRTPDNLRISDIEKLIDPTNQSVRLAQDQRELLQRTYDMLTQSNRLLPTMLQTLTERIQALNNAAVNDLINSRDDLTTQELLNVLNAQRASGDNTDDQLELLENISQTLQSMEQLEQEGQLSRAERIQQRINNANQSTTLENIEEYLQNLDPTEKRAKSMFSSTASSMEELGEDMADNLMDWIGGSDWYQEKSQKVKDKINRGKSRVRDAFGRGRDRIRNSRAAGGLRSLRGRLGGVGRLLGLGGSVAAAGEGMIPRAASASTSFVGRAVSGTASALGSATELGSRVVSGGSKLLSKVAAPIAAAVNIAQGISAYNEAENSQERKAVVGETSGGTVGALVGGALGTLIPIPGVGTIAGAMLGDWIGSKIGGWISGWFTDITDYIPDQVKNSENPIDEIWFIDNVMMPKLQANPAEFNITDEDDAKEAVEDLLKYRDKLIKKNADKMGQYKTPEQIKKDLDVRANNIQASKTVTVADLDSEVKSIDDQINNELFAGSKKDLQAYKEKLLAKRRELTDYRAEQQVASNSKIPTPVDFEVSTVSEEVPEIVSSVMSDMNTGVAKTMASRVPDAAKMVNNQAELVNSLMAKDQAQASTGATVINNITNNTIINGSGSSVGDPLTNGLR